MSISSQRQRARALRLYTLLLHLYPLAYRYTFATQMVQTFADLITDYQAQDKRLGIMFWGEVLSDEGIAMLREWWDALLIRGRELPPQVAGCLFGAFLGVPITVCSACMLLMPVNSRAVQGAWITLVVLLAGVLPLCVLYQAYRHAQIAANPFTSKGYLPAAMLSTAVFVLLSMPLITLLWLPQVRAVAQQDPGMIADWHRSGTPTFDQFLLNDNLQASLVLTSIAVCLGLVAASIGTKLGSVIRRAA